MKKKSKHDHLMTFSLSALMLLGVASCGSDDDDDGNGSGGSQKEEDVGAYRAKLSPINTSVAGSPSGDAVVTILADQITVAVNANGVPKNMEHLQNIFVGSSCPTAAADKNGDGIIDITEAIPSTGKILVPLDSDLGDQSSGANNYPSANSNGNYVYTESASLSKFLADLRSPDTTTDDAIVKIGADEPLNLSNRVIIVHGVPQSTNLPGTIASISGASANATVPILCGKLERVAGADVAGTTGGTTGTTTGGTTGTTTGGTTGTTTGGTTGTTTGGTTGTTTGGTTGTTTGGTTGTTTGGTTGTTTGGTTGG